MLKDKRQRDDAQSSRPRRRGYTDVRCSICELYVKGQFLAEGPPGAEIGGLIHQGAPPLPTTGPSWVTCRRPLLFLHFCSCHSRSNSIPDSGASRIC